MTDDEKLDQLLESWQSAAEEGRELSPAGLCANCPELQSRLEQEISVIRRFKQLAASAAPGPDHSNTPPDTARYQFQSFIARGGMGEVWRAHDAELKRDVAIKVLKPTVGGPPDRFREEAELVARLEHPSIIPVYDAGTLPDGRSFFAMKLIRERGTEAVAGSPPPTLDELLARRSNLADDLPRFIQVLQQVCEAVSYAHSLNPPVLHRDLKPSNIMVGAFGEVLVMDWGIAKVLRESESPHDVPAVRQPPPLEGNETGKLSGTDLDRTAAYIHVGPDTTSQEHRQDTRTGDAKGTLAYMPPEQARGDRQTIGPAADVFALGGVLCAILTGKPPHTGPAAEAFERVRVGDLTRAFDRLDHSGADAELIAIAKKCLAPNSAERYADASVLARTMAEYRGGIEDRLHRAEMERVRAEAEAREQRKRRRVQLALAVAIGLVATGGGALAWQAASEARNERERRSRNAEALTSLVERCETALREDDADRAEAALGQIDRRLSEGGGEAITERAERCRKDLAMLKELDEIYAFSWKPVANKLPGVHAVIARWQAAFGKFGLAVTESAKDRSLDVLNESLLRERILAVLDLWLIGEPVDAIRVILKHADPDEYRDAMRDSVVTKDDQRQASLAGLPVAFEQPSRFVAALARLSAVPLERRRALLETALQSRPGDLELLMNLSKGYPVNQRTGAEARVRWLQAAAAAHPQFVVAYTNLGLALKDAEDWQGAVIVSRQAIRLDRNDATAYNNLGMSLYALGERTDAEMAYRKAIQLAQDFAMPHYNLGIFFQDSRHLEAAVGAYRDATRLDPKYGEAHSNLAWLLATGPDRIRDGKSAVEHAKVACELFRWDHPVPLATLAAAHAASGEFDKAIEYQKKALTFPEFEIESGKEGRECLELYRQKKLYYDPRFFLSEPAPPPRVVGKY